MLDGGGALMNQSIHLVDALLHIAGPVTSVRAVTVVCEVARENSKLI